MEEQFKRNCPICKKDIFHTNKYNRNNQEKKKKPCRSCSTKIQLKKQGNPMKGRSVYSVWLEKYGKEEADRRAKQQAEKIAKKAKGRPLTYDISGKNNPFYGKKHTKETKAKLKTWIANNRDFNGEKNPMFGKSPGKGAGIGIGGHYKGWYFRSLYELVYMINVIERFKLPWENGESLRIKYWDNETKRNRTYVPDFIINDKYIVEIKPQPLWEQKTIIQKANAAKDLAKNNGMIYKMIDPVHSFKSQQLVKLYEEGKITLDKKSHHKFEKRFIR